MPPSRGVIRLPVAVHDAATTGTEEVGAAGWLAPRLGVGLTGASARSWECRPRAGPVDKIERAADGEDADDGGRGQAELQLRHEEPPR
jgi:hypothetical protein